jgi:hypothetical protein
MRSIFMIGDAEREWAAILGWRKQSSHPVMWVLRPKIAFGGWTPPERLLVFELTLDHGTDDGALRDSPRNGV